MALIQVTSTLRGLLGRKKADSQEIKLTELDMREKLDAQKQMLIQATVINATAQVASQAIATGKSPQEAVQTMSETYELMQDWFSGAPFKEQIRQLMDTMLPERYY